MTDSGFSEIREIGWGNFGTNVINLATKKWRNELASDCVSGVSVDELDGLRWRIEFKVFQSVRGLEDDSVTRFNPSSF